jgi:RNA polymerase sigma-70 factor (ECF subfamily)
MKVHNRLIAQLAYSTGTLPVSINLEQLVQGSQVRDPSISEALVNQYYASIYRLALSILNNPDDAEDATQETFIAAINNLDGYRGASSLKTWLYAIGLNTCRGHLRKRRARDTMRKAWQSLQPLRSRPPTPEQTALSHESHTQLWAAVDALDEKHRLPVILRYAHNMSVSEIAETLDVNEGTVHSRLHYARKKLHGHLQFAGILDRGSEAES